MCAGDLGKMIIAVKGAGDLATGVALRLRKCGLRKIVMLEVPRPLAVRRNVTFCEAIYDGQTEVEGISAVAVSGVAELGAVWDSGAIAVLVDPQWNCLGSLAADVLIDGILAKKNLGTARGDARLVIGLGPGFNAGVDVDLIVETKRGHDLGRVIASGSAIANTGVPGAVNGYTTERVLRSPRDGVFTSRARITDFVKAGDLLGEVDGEEVLATIDGVLRGLIRSGCSVKKGLKIGDIDPRGNRENCFTVSDKARAVGGGVLEAILSSLDSRPA